MSTDSSTQDTAAEQGAGRTTTHGSTRGGRNARRLLQGIVTSNKMEKTITVEVQRLVKHPVYEKFIRRRTRIHAHDDASTANVGDRVEIVETRPISKLKRFRLTRVVARAVQD
ncbi:MAG: 30S ribosomal protein S17 [Planctomycetota bacterium]